MTQEEIKEEAAWMFAKISLVNESANLILRVILFCLIGFWGLVVPSGRSRLMPLCTQITGIKSVFSKHFLSYCLFIGIRQKKAFGNPSEKSI
jgi:hypothetical protein